MSPEPNRAAVARNLAAMLDELAAEHSSAGRQAMERETRRNAAALRAILRPQEAPHA